jgi:hypothetical protein
MRHRGHGEDAIYLEPAKNRYVGAVSLGFGSDGCQDFWRSPGWAVELHGPEEFPSGCSGSSSR